MSWLTDKEEACVEFLQSTGWMQEHDRIMSKPHWILCADKLPTVGEYVLVGGDHFINCIWKLEKTVRGEYYWEDDDAYGFSFENVKYWMPLPDEPENEK